MISKPTPHGIESALNLPRIQNWTSELKFTKDGPWATCNEPLKGKAVAVLGGGPSLDKLTQAALLPYDPIYVNNSYMLAKRPGVLVCLDRRYMDWHSKAALQMGHTIVTSCRDRAWPNLQPHQYFSFKKDREATMPENREVLPGLNSGHAAICLAYLAGASRIYVAGFDMGFRKGRTHWHEGHKVPSSEQNYVTRFRPRFEKLVRMLDQNGVQVFTVTPSFAAVPKIELYEAVEDLRECHEQHG